MALNERLRVALIGTGNRSKTTYRPLFDFLKPWVEMVAVCDPVVESADEFAESLGVPAFYDLKELVKARPMEAAFVVSPIPSHHSICCYLLSHGIHVNVETSMCNLLIQGQEMVQAARDHNTILRIAENFFRFPFDRMMKLIADDDFIGPVKRLTCWHDHTGYHNNSRWIRFSARIPPRRKRYPMSCRQRDTISWRIAITNRKSTARTFSGSLMRRWSLTMPAISKVCWGAIRGRDTRNWQGRAAQSCRKPEKAGTASAKCAIAPTMRCKWRTSRPGLPHRASRRRRDWLSSHVDFPTGRIEYGNPFRLGANAYHRRNYYSAAVISHIVDFAETVRGMRESEYSDADALMAMMMDVATRESAIQQGKRLSLPLAGELESEVQLRAALRHEYGVDPLDIEGMLGISYPRP